MTSISPFPATRQISFHHLLREARGKWLLENLRKVVSELDPNELKVQLSEYIPADIQQILAAQGIRDEDVFPTPMVLEAGPMLVGYYRLLLGIGQKTFYRSGTGMGRLQKMEINGTINDRQRGILPAFCRAMSVSMSSLVRELRNDLTPRDIGELPLLTLGSQFQGGANVAIGQQATKEVFRAIIDIVGAYTETQTTQSITVINAAGRRVVISSASDPDVSIREQVGDLIRNRVAIEIKGGTDVANVHNRAGEAEKSHLKAKSEDFRDFWTIISTNGVNSDRLQAESPTTTSWFNAPEILVREGSDWDEFRSRIAEAVGIPLDE